MTAARYVMTRRGGHYGYLVERAGIAFRTPWTTQPRPSVVFDPEDRPVVEAIVWEIDGDA